MFLSITVSLYQPEKKLHKVLSGIVSMIVLLSGILLLRRFGISHSGPFPAWVIVKMGIWLSVTMITPIVIKRFTKFSKFLYLPWILLIFIAIAMAIYKPL